MIDPGLLHLLDVDSLDTATYEERVYTPIKYTMLSLKNYPIQNVSQIDGQDASDIINATQRNVVYLNTQKTRPKNTKYIKVVYTAGYDTIPANLMELNTMYQNIMQNQTQYAGVATYKLGDESISFGDNDTYLSFMRLYQIYRKPRIVG